MWGWEGRTASALVLDFPSNVTTTKPNDKMPYPFVTVLMHWIVNKFTLANSWLLTSQHLARHDLWGSTSGLSPLSATTSKQLGYKQPTILVTNNFLTGPRLKTSWSMRPILYYIPWPSSLGSHLLALCNIDDYGLWKRLTNGQWHCGHLWNTLCNFIIRVWYVPTKMNSCLSFSSYSLCVLIGNSFSRYIKHPKLLIADFSLA